MSYQFPVGMLSTKQIYIYVSSVLQLKLYRQITFCILLKLNKNKELDLFTSSTLTLLRRRKFVRASPPLGSYYNRSMRPRCKHAIKPLVVLYDDQWETKVEILNSNSGKQNKEWCYKFFT